MKHLPDIDPSKLEVTKTITPKQLVPNQDLIFGRTFTGEHSPQPIARSNSHVDSHQVHVKLRLTRCAIQTTCSR